MTTLILHHDDCQLHDTGTGHPERPGRTRAVREALEGLPGLEWLPAPRATPEQLSRVHPPSYQERVKAALPAEGNATFDEPDLVLSPGSLDAALRGSGATCFAIDQVMAGYARNAFCVTRPPGHHAEAEKAMGFCLFNHVAVGARHAQAEHGLARVAILDFDVHHGNGTQAIFERDPSVVFVSSHQMPLYPGTGFAEEHGRGNILNLPLRPGTGSAEFRDAWSHIGLPAVRAFKPELVLVSAGFDAHERDPIAHVELQEEDYAWITREFLALADEYCHGRLVSNLEGGYDLDALAACARIHIETLLA